MASSPFARDGLLRVEVEEGDVLVVRAVGVIDIATAKKLEKSLRQVFSRDGSSMVLDLTEVDFVDSTGMRTLLWAKARSDENGGDLHIRASDAVRRSIEITAPDQFPLTG